MDIGRVAALLRRCRSGRGVLGPALGALAAWSLLAPVGAAADVEFQDPDLYQLRPGPHDITLGDLNEDGSTDLIAAVTQDFDCRCGGLDALSGAPDGSFAPGPAIHLPFNTGPTATAVGDFGLVQPSIALAGVRGSEPDRYFGRVWILGQESGSFSSSSSYRMGRSAADVVAGQLVGGGWDDVAATNPARDRVSVFRGRGDGTLGRRVDYPAGEGASEIASGDFDGDGRDDLAIANPEGDAVSVLLRRPDGSLRAPATYEAGGAPSDIVAADFNGDAAQDLAVVKASGTKVRVLIGGGDGTFSPATAYAAQPEADPFGTSDIAAGDLNGDGYEDLAVATYEAPIAVLENDGSGGFADPVAQPVASRCCSDVGSADFNHDDVDDLAVTYSLDGRPPAPGEAAILLGLNQG